MKRSSNGSCDRAVRSMTSIVDVSTNCVVCDVSSSAIVSDDLHSVFENGDHIKMVIRELLRGAIQGRALWDVLRRNQRYRDVAGEWPDFGSGGIRHPRRRKSKRPPSWHWPGPSRRSRRGGFKLPKFPAPRQSRSRGGFRTGGQF